MELPRTTVETFDGNATEESQEVLDPAVATVGRLDVQGTAREAVFSRCYAAAISSIFENQSRNRARSIRLSPRSKANWEPVQQPSPRIVN